MGGINIWENPGYRWHEFRAWWSWFKWACRMTKERATKGYCSYDVGELNVFYATVLRDGLNEYAKNCTVEPTTYNTLESWEDDVRAAAKGFEIYLKALDADTPENIRFRQLLIDIYTENPKISEAGKEFLYPEYKTLLNAAIESDKREITKAQELMKKSCNILVRIFPSLWL